ncbi:MAG: jacalin-like lectin [Bacteroidota bacterium]
MNEYSSLHTVGGGGGDARDAITVPPGCRLTAITVYTGQFVHAIELQYRDLDGQHHTTGRLGAQGGTPHTFALEDDEHVTGVSGRAGWYVDLVQFHTHRRYSAPLGGPGGSPYEVFVTEGQEISGFSGRSGWYLDALTVLTRSTASPAKASKKPKRKPAAKKSKPKLAADDLRKITGIGPKIAGLLQAAGIATFAQLAETSVEAIERILDEAGSRYRIANPVSWPKQAALATEEKWEELKAFVQKG